jgi:hypothetical protein
VRPQVVHAPDHISVSERRYPRHSTARHSAFSREPPGTPKPVGPLLPHRWQNTIFQTFVHAPFSARKATEANRSRAGIRRSTVSTSWVLDGVRFCAVDSLQIHGRLLTKIIIPVHNSSATRRTRSASAAPEPFRRQQRPWPLASRRSWREMTGEFVEMSKQIRDGGNR